MAPDTAALVARLREYAGEVMHIRDDDPPHSNEYECAVAALEAADLLEGHREYEKCADYLCPLFVEPNDVKSPAYYCPTCKRPVTLLQDERGAGWYHEDDESLLCGSTQWSGSPNAGQLDLPEKVVFAAYVHLHRGDDADEAIDESHEAKPSGLVANLAAWKAFGPDEMRKRFVGGPTEAAMCGTSFMAGSICTLWPNHHGGHQQRCPYCGVDENAEDHRPNCPNYPEPEENGD